MIQDNNKKKNIKILQGVVVSDKADKTVIVKVDRVKFHPKYEKKFKVSDRYKAHDKENKFKIGDFVEIQQCRPLSKDKRWRVIKIITK